MDELPFRNDPDSVRRLDFSLHPLKTEARVKRFCEIFYKGKVFISHTANDTDWCYEHIIPHLGRFDNCFFLSWKADPHMLDLHRALVVFAFRFVKTVILVASENSRSSDWVRQEVKWAIEQDHPMIICITGAIDPAELHPELSISKIRSSTNPPRRLIDFRNRVGDAESELRNLLQTKEFRIEPDRNQIAVGHLTNWVDQWDPP
jgi:hypothetical protein